MEKKDVEHEIKALERAHQLSHMKEKLKRE